MPADSETILHGSEYTAMLSDSEYKSKLLSYISNSFLQLAIESNVSTVIIDSPAFTSLKIISSGCVFDLPANEHGEADYAIWYHAIRTNVNILSKDTDTWVYGLGLIEYVISMLLLN